MFDLILKSAAGAALALTCATAVIAEDIAAPQGDVILTVSGDIDVTNAGDILQFDREQLAALDTTTFKTTTIWSAGVNTFEGASLSALTALLDLKDGKLLATAINDYTVEIPVSDAVEGGPIIAFLMNGAEMSIRDKGPLSIVYPYDASDDFRSEVVYSRSIWQLDRIEVIR